MSNFLLDKRGTTDQFTFSSELVLRLAFAVETAAENKDVFPDGRYDRLPEPIDLKRIAVVKYQWGDQSFELFCTACSLVTDLWEETGEMLTWLHMKGLQAFRGQVTDKPGVKLLVPIKYVLTIEPGPNFRRTKKRAGVEVGVFSPDRPPPPRAMKASEIENAFATLQIPMVTTTLTVYRPDYQLKSQVQPARPAEPSAPLPTPPPPPSEGK